MIVSEYDENIPIVDSILSRILEILLIDVFVPTVVKMTVYFPFFISFLFYEMDEQQNFFPVLFYVIYTFCLFITSIHYTANH